MNFFEAQTQARRRTGRLVFLFILAVIGTILAAYAATLCIVFGSAPTAHGGGVPLWEPSLFAGSSLTVLVIVGLASWTKWSQFSKGGGEVARMVGGRQVLPGSANNQERVLLNVVEEMAIASGVNVPAVYVLDEEEGINAFAAGLTTSDAVVAVTRGTLQRLNRDELQGVVAHEFSHILNGDMRLNVRLSAVLFGILVLGLIGRGVLRVLGRGRVRAGRGKKGNGVAVIVAIGVALMIIGYVGYFFGRLIQAAVSRQREFLADASAVQFTRNPLGIAGALRKIGASSEGSRLESDKASQIGHFFFAQSFNSWVGSLFATHPPLPDRIRAIDSSWDGNFDARSALKPTPTAAEKAETEEEPLAEILPPVLVAAASVRFSPDSVLARAGTVTDEHFRGAQALLAQVPETLRSAARGEGKAQALVLAVLCAGAPGSATSALELIRNKLGSQLADEAAALAVPVSQCPPSVRLPLIQLAAPVLRELDATASEALLGLIEEISRLDGVVSPLEVAVSKILIRSLRLAKRPAPVIQFHSFNAVRNEIVMVLSTLAHTSDTRTESARNALDAGLAQLRSLEGGLNLVPAAQCSLQAFSAALGKLELSSLPIRKRVLVAAATLIGADGQVTLAEAELYRAIAAALDCPMPVWEQTAGT